MNKKISVNNAKIKKTKNRKWLLIGTFLLLIICFLTGYLYWVISSPKYVIKQSVIKAFKNVENFAPNQEQEKNIQFTSAIKIKENILGNKFANDILNISGFYNNVDRQFQVNGSILENDKMLVDGTILYAKDGAYIKSESLLSNVYDISNADCNLDDKFICQLQKFYNILTVDDGINSDNISLNAAIISLKQAILDSISNDNVYRNKGTFKDENVNYNKYTYRLDKETIKSIYSKLDANAKYYLYKIAYNFFDNVSSADDLETALINKINNISDYLEINIYTNGLFNKFMGLEVGNNSSFLYFDYDNTTNSLNLSLPKNSLKLETTGNIDSIDGSIYYKNKVIATFSYAKDNDATIFNCKSNVLGMNININITNKLKDKQENIVGTLVVNVNLDTFIYKAEVSVSNDYSLSNSITIDKLDTTGALMYNDMSQEEKDNVSVKLQELYQTFFGNLVFGE